MARNGKVLVAMSGGVDSSVAACLLKDAGYDCVGVFMRVGTAGQGGDGAEGGQGVGRGLDAQAIERDRDDQKVERGCDAQAVGEDRDNQSIGHGRDAPGVETAAVGPGGTPRARLKHGCCSIEDALDARAVAARLGMPFYVLNFEPDFASIVDYFVDEYARGQTPNPCVRCNIELKFGKLLRYADMLGAEFVATGHYARILRGGNVGRWEGGKGGLPPAANDPAAGENRPERACLARARNLAKDQSYVLFGIRRIDLPRCLFPIGEIEDKATVRQMAAELGLRVHDKPDSQEICFVPDGDYKELVRSRRPETLRPGEMVDAGGRVVGTHAGLANYTIGQRHGLGVTTDKFPAAAGRPLYVTRLDVLANAVVIGTREELLAEGLVAERVNWLVDPPVVSQHGSSAADDAGRRVWVKIRHMHNPVPATMRFANDRSANGGERHGDERSTNPQAATENPDAVEIRFDAPQSAVTPGQAAVFYDDDGIVLGGGWIAQAL